MKTKRIYTEEQKLANRARVSKWQRENKDKVRIRNKKQRDKLKAEGRRYYVLKGIVKNTPEQKKAATLERQRRYVEKNREKVYAASEKWRLNNPHKAAAKSNRHRAAKWKATFTGYDNEIEAIYKEAQYLTQVTGIPHEVDHIIPLNNKKVTGLHVPWNLRAIPARENRSKSNKLVDL